jgi:hypothetical protein
LGGSPPGCGDGGGDWAADNPNSRSRTKFKNNTPTFQCHLPETGFAFWLFYFIGHLLALSLWFELYYTLHPLCFLRYRLLKAPGRKPEHTGS